MKGEEGRCQFSFSRFGVGPACLKKKKKKLPGDSNALVKDSTLSGKNPEINDPNKAAMTKKQQKNATSDLQ